jgi:hypothetical protein
LRFLLGNSAASAGVAWPWTSAGVVAGVAGVVGVVLVVPERETGVLGVEAESVRLGVEGADRVAPRAAGVAGVTGVLARGTGAGVVGAVPAGDGVVAGVPGAVGVGVWVGVAGAVAVAGVWVDGVAGACRSGAVGELGTAVVAPGARAGAGRLLAGTGRGCSGSWD